MAAEAKSNDGTLTHTAPRSRNDALLQRYRAYRSLPQMVIEQAEKQGDRPCLWSKQGGEWRPFTYRTVATQASALARRLQALGIKPGDRVALISENRPEWGIADVAIMSVGAATVPAYITNTPRDHEYILTHSGARGVIVSTAQIAKRVLPALANAPEVRFVIVMEALAAADTAQCRVPIEAWSVALSAGGGLPDTVSDCVARLKRQDMACIIYTSGTGGTPKGVMLSHGAILTNCLGAYDLLLKFGLSDEVFLSFLPLSHSYEHSAGLYFPLSLGAQIYYAEGVEQLVANMAEVKPTIMTAVPRLYESMQRRVVQGLQKQSATKQAFFRKALALGRKRYEAPERLSFLDRAVDALLDSLVRKKVAARFGGRLKAFVSGGAPLNYEVGLFFNALGVVMLQGYGQTESAPVVSCNPPEKIKIHTVGPVCPDVEVRIADDGEILVRGELVMLGYWKDPAATAAAVRDGWLHTGDIGRLDGDGYLQITDRKKDIIVLSGGDNVAPARVEGFLTLQPEIGQTMIYGDKRPHLVAIIVPEAEWLKRWASENGKRLDQKALASDPDLKKAFAAVVERVNADLSVLERVKRFVIATEPFSIDNGMMTPTMKVRRHVVRDTYREQLEGLYGAG
ncbi:MAG: long-chain fatty acid--CoA ligase [Alphaproteobacteria bacterium]|nr:long-chain fatty acid--CoA ligase [Alphaproteobacteria bacterium]